MERSTSHCLLWKGINGGEAWRGEARRVEARISVKGTVNNQLSLMEGNKRRRGLARRGLARRGEYQCERTLV
jgi:hypothetical protein